MEKEKRIRALEKENAKLKRQLEIRQICLCIPLEKIRFKDYMEGLKFQEIKNTPSRLKENLRLLELIIPAIEIG